MYHVFQSGGKQVDLQCSNLVFKVTSDAISGVREYSQSSGSYVCVVDSLYEVTQLKVK